MPMMAMTTSNSIKVKAPVRSFMVRPPIQASAVASVGCFVTVLRELFLRSYQAVQAVLESHQATWQSLPAFAQAVDEFTALIPEINDLAQTQASRTGFADEKAFALEGMGNATFEVVAAVLAYASVAEDHELAGRVDFSRSAITGGRESEAVARAGTSWRRPRPMWIRSRITG
jgi:hypothetical protein